MKPSSHRFAVELSRPDGSPLGQFDTNPDWLPVEEWLRFLALRHGQLRGDEPGLLLRIEPLWDEDRGQPYVRALRAALGRIGTAPVLDTEIPTRFFRAIARSAASGLVEEKVLQAGETFLYAVTAYPESERQPRGKVAGFALQEIPVATPVSAASLSQLEAAAIRHGPTHEDDCPVFIPQQVVHEMRLQTEQADRAESGAILLGHLRKDGAAFFVEVTAQVPARNTTAGLTRLSFSAATWSAARAALQLRNRQELMVGWFHSHPARHWCQTDCPPERRQSCAFNRPFFSERDCALHRGVFSKAFCVALLATNSNQGMKWNLFGWRRGLIVERSYHIVHGDLDRHPPAIEETASIGDKQHETPCRP